MTLLFSDLVGSTVLSERVEPEQLRDLFAFYRAAARERSPGTAATSCTTRATASSPASAIPKPHEDDARRAVLAGLDLGVAMRDARAELDRRFGVAPEVRVGIHTGRVVVTDLSDDRVAERDSIVGLVPSLAARHPAGGRARHGRDQRRHPASRRRRLLPAARWASGS